MADVAEGQASSSSHVPANFSMLTQVEHVTALLTLAHILNQLTKPRIRHINAIQVRNLTLFPARDALASALSQPSEQPQFTAHGQLSDDWDVTLTRRRGRRISLSSINSLHSLRSDGVNSDDIPLGSPVVEPRVRARKGSKASFTGSATVGPSSPGPPLSRTRTVSNSGAAPTIRPHRIRTTSVTSTTNSPFAVIPALTPVASAMSSISAPLSAMLPDNSQTGLEKVIKSRLIETFITITIPSSQHGREYHTDPCPHSVTSSSASAPSTPLTSSTLREKNTPSAKKSKPAGGKELTPRTTSPNKITRSSSDMPGSSRSPPIKSPSFRSKFPSAHPRPPINGITSSPPSPSNRVVVWSTSTSRPAPSSQTSSFPVSDAVPNYLSPIHRPSTNPLFTIDTRSTSEFAPWTDLSSDKLIAGIWGRVSRELSRGISCSVKGKEKQDSNTDVASDPEWRLLQEWVVDLNELLPLPHESSMDVSQLGSNALLITLSPPGRTFYLPHSLAKYSSPPTPDPGYNSDPEVEVRKSVQPIDGLPLTTGPLSMHPSEALSHPRRRHRQGAGGRKDSAEDTVKTASWQDLFMLVTIQSCILDTQTSLDEILRDVGKIIESDQLCPLKREAAEYESWIDELRSECIGVGANCNSLRLKIQARRKELEERRAILASVREQLDADMTVFNDMESDVHYEAHRLQTLRGRLRPIRTTLISILSSIFPIDLLSPPDLLYTILDVPLPIPMAGNDPAPPLSLAHHKEVTEDAIATSLGYAAQVLQLLAAYLGKGLVYPVTCIGSRSLVRDGISTMVGPRMFPLFPKGVDTYRFEYGVFLLNKDLEMLMVERNLRALDMRHTLPNLKNLLLTLTDGEGVESGLRSVASLAISTSFTSPRPESPETTETNVSTPKARALVELPAESITPPASGRTTPTATVVDSPDTIKRAKTFLSLPPLTSFLRSRVPSVSSRLLTKSPLDGGQDSYETPSIDSSQVSDTPAPANRDDDEDRRTIRGVPAAGLSHDHGDGEVGKENGDLHVTVVRDERTNEKEVISPTAPTLPRPPISPVHS